MYLLRRCDEAGHTFRHADLSESERMMYESAGMCECDGVSWKCPSGAGGVPPPERLTDTGMRLYDLTDNHLSTSDHILETFHDYILSRFA